MESSALIEYVQVNEKKVADLERQVAELTEERDTYIQMSERLEVAVKGYALELETYKRNAPAPGKFFTPTTALIFLGHVSAIGETIKQYTGDENIATSPDFIAKMQELGEEARSVFLGDAQVQ